MLKARTLIAVFVVLLIVVSYWSCKKSKNGNSGTVVIKLNGTYNGQYFGLDTFNTDPMGNVIAVTAFKFFLSNITLVKTNNDTVNVSAVTYFDFSMPSTLTVQINNVASGDFKAISFGCGLDSIQNNTDIGWVDTNDYSSPLSSQYDMYWPMLKYRFEVFEGEWATSKAALANNQTGLTYHIGGNSYYRLTQLNQNFSICCGNTTTLNLNLDVQKLFYTSADTLSIVTENYTVCSPTDNPVVAPTFATNFSQAFSLSQ